MKDTPKPIFSIGELVVIKSYPSEVPVETQILIKGDPLHVPPIMMITGIEIESKKKKLFDAELGVKIAERIKYNVLWFDNKKSNFNEKVLYESLLKSVEKPRSKSLTLEYGSSVKLRSKDLEKNKVKSSNYESKTTCKGKENQPVEKKHDNITPLLTFVAPNFIVTGIKKCSESNLFGDNGLQIRYRTEKLIKIMWFNYVLQKYSEYEVPQECLIKS